MSSPASSSLRTDRSLIAEPARRVIVVGGGIAGLVTARELAIGGLDVTLVEASDRLGGKVARHTVAGLPLDSGAESFATRNDTVADYLRELGLGERIVTPNQEGAWVRNVDGTSFPLPKTGILGIPGTPLARDVIDVIGLAGAFRAQLDVLMSEFVGSKERTLGRLVRRRLGRRVLDRLVAPVTLGIHSRHPDDLDLDVVAPGLRAALRDTGSLTHAVRAIRGAAPAGSAVSGLEGGIFELVDTLEHELERLGVTVLLSTRVSGVDASGVDLAEPTIDGARRIEADLVVAANSPGAAGAASIVLATLVLDAPGLDSAPRGTGLLVAPGAPGVTAKALTHATAKWAWLGVRAGEHRHVVRLSYPAPGSRDLRNQALRDASLLLGVELDDSQVLGFAQVEWAPPPPLPAPVDGVTMVGEGAAGTGLAAVIAHARLQAGRLLEGVEG